MYIGVIGAGRCDAKLFDIAYEVGRLIAQRGAILVCGGLGGVMEAACKGAKSAGGLTLGILPSEDRKHANPYVNVVVPTGLGEARNALVVRTADVLIAVGGEFGTLSEIALALKVGKPVVGIGTWELAKGGRPVEAILIAKDPHEAVERALRVSLKS
ncbi:MAG TPA: TIGR00725 family protein [Actinobacteria bacterium]|nr:TIGR00725 family protein [Actinomycetota bacterium]